MVKLIKKETKIGEKPRRMRIMIRKGRNGRRKI
jgi:hypothetical protein